MYELFKINNLKKAKIRDQLTLITDASPSPSLDTPVPSNLMNLLPQHKRPNTHFTKLVINKPPSRANANPSP